MRTREPFEKADKSNLPKECDAGRTHAAAMLVYRIRTSNFGSHTNEMLRLNQCDMLCASGFPTRVL